MRRIWTPGSKISWFFLTFDLGEGFEIKTSLCQQVKYFYNYMLTEIYEQTGRMENHSLHSAKTRE